MHRRDEHRVDDLGGLRSHSVLADCGDGVETQQAGNGDAVGAGDLRALGAPQSIRQQCRVRLGVLDDLFAQSGDVAAGRDHALLASDRISHGPPRFEEALRGFVAPGVDRVDWSEQTSV
ncbi:hypothetical protein GCM10029992_07850 [Glycomyces albus]